MLMKFLQLYNEEGLKNIVFDRNMIAFDNGLLFLSERQFIPYCDLDESMTKRCARHHIHSDFDGSTETPMFDKLLKFQMSDEVYDYLLIMIGRLFFPVGLYDNWQVMAFLYGDANTGKSSLINIIKALFSVGNIAVISSNMENLFGLDGKYDKELVIAFDIPKHMQNVVDQNIWQSMVSGEDIQIPRKNLQALSQQWTIPMIWASNYIPDYKDGSGSVSRRLMMFLYRKYLDACDKDTTLQKRIIQQELPAILLKSLNAYFDTVEKHGSEDIWTFCPQELRDNQDLIRADADNLYRFLTAGRDENQSSSHRYYVMFEQGAITQMSRIKDVFKNYMRFKYPESKDKMWPEDESAFKRLGYIVEKCNLCKSCDHAHKVGCCANYSRANRTCKVVIWNLKLVTEEIY
jgi:phage/plasmid-associated DNA primase